MKKQAAHDPTKMKIIVKLCDAYGAGTKTLRRKKYDTDCVYADHDKKELVTWERANSKQTIPCFLKDSYDLNLTWSDNKKWKWTIKNLNW